MRKLILLGVSAAVLFPGGAFAQTGFAGTWKIDVSTLPYSKRPLIWLVQDGIYECRSCMPPIRVSADGQDQRVIGQSYDKISVAIVDGRTIHLIQKKNDRIDSDERFTVSADGNTATDEFANWKFSMHRTANAPPGSHLMSGTWQPFKLESTSDRELLVTFKLEGEKLSMTRPTGQWYRATLDGPDAPYNGEPRFNGVSVRRIDASTIEETDKFNGKVLVVSRMSISSDGKSMTITVKGLEAHETEQFTAIKQ